jgi:hypothetical protein
MELTVRIITAAAFLSLLVGCASERPAGPREYLDEKTSATITMVAEPWVFASDGAAAGEERDFLNVYAIDVNRMGDHRQYLAVLQWWPPQPMSANALGPTLELQADDRKISLQPIMVDARELGLAQPVETAHPAASKWWYFPVDKQILGAVARSQNLQATMLAGEQRTAYVIWRDGRADVAELTEALQ